jgi:hypothetical protein
VVPAGSKKRFFLLTTAEAPPPKAEAEPEMITLTRPEWMTIEDVEVIDWRGRAFAYKELPRGPSG